MITPSPVANLAPSLPACHSITSTEKNPGRKQRSHVGTDIQTIQSWFHRDTPGFASGQLRTKSHSYKYAQFTLGSMNRSPKLHLPMNQIWRIMYLRILLHMTTPDMNHIWLHMATPHDKSVTSCHLQLPITLGSKNRSPDVSMRPGGMREAIE